MLSGGRLLLYAIWLLVSETVVLPVATTHSHMHTATTENGLPVNIPAVLQETPLSKYAICSSLLSNHVCTLISQPIP